MKREKARKEKRLAVNRALSGTGTFPPVLLIQYANTRDIRGADITEEIVRTVSAAPWRAPTSSGATWEGKKERTNNQKRKREWNTTYYYFLLVLRKKEGRNNHLFLIV